MKKNNQGQILIEFLIAVPLLTFLILFTAQAIYFTYADYWIQFSLYEANICMAQQENKSVCKRKLLSQIKIGTPFGKVTKAELNYSKSYTTNISWVFSNKRYSYSNTLEKL